MYHVYMSNNIIPSICCANDSIRVVELIQYYHNNNMVVTDIEETLKSIESIFTKDEKAQFTWRKDGWAFIKRYQNELEPCLWVYENTTHIYTLQDRIIVFVKIG